MCDGALKVDRKVELPWNCTRKCIPYRHSSEKIFIFHGEDCPNKETPK